MYYKDTGVNAFAWGAGGKNNRERRRIALDIGIITPQQRLTRPRIIQFLQQANQNHPHRNIFEEALT